MRIYISGPMTGHPDHNIPAFDAAEERPLKQGHFVINPVEISKLFGPVDNVDYSFSVMYNIERRKGDYCMREDFEKEATLARSIIDADLAAVRSCDRIYLLKGWENSRGAKKELAEAIKCGLEVRQEGGEE